MVFVVSTGSHQVAGEGDRGKYLDEEITKVSMTD